MASFLNSISPFLNIASSVLDVAIVVLLLMIVNDLKKEKEKQVQNSWSHHPLFWKISFFKKVDATTAGR